MEQEIYGDKGYDEVIDKPCKIEGCVNFDYENGLCNTHFDELEGHDCHKGQDSGCECEKYDER